MDKIPTTENLAPICPEHLTLRVPNEIYRYWIEDNYFDPLRAAALFTLKSAREIRFVSAGLAQVPHHEPERVKPRVQLTEEETDEKAVANGLNPKNSFDNFVVGCI